MQDVVLLVFFGCVSQQLIAWVVESYNCLHGLRSRLHVRFPMPFFFRARPVSAIRDRSPVAQWGLVEFDERKMDVWAQAYERMTWDMESFFEQTRNNCRNTEQY